ncbi:MAG: hypothetical protein M3M96_00780, partial [Candidatus Eremiobacteraeota bacterium]|nr:hypothetical protein [Candidatus Eremiobacteraeota bacterium]
MPVLRVELLGPARMSFDGVLYPYKAPPKCLPLLGYLLLHRETAVSREALAYSMWADDTEQEARANLRRHLHRLARALPNSGTDWVISDTTTVRWNSASTFTSDVDDFLQWSSESGRAEEAIRLYRGELLEGVYEDWVFPERERFRALQIENLNKLMRSAQSDRAFDRAIGFAKELLALDPWRENTLRALMMLRQSQGDRAGAIAEYEAFAAHLQREMATAPMAETAGAYEALLRNESLPELQPADDVPRPAPHRAPTLPFAGRDIELDRLSVPWGRAARRHG